MFKNFFRLVLIISFVLSSYVESALARAGGRSSFGSGRSSTSYINQGSRGSKTFQGGGNNQRNYAPMQKTTKNAEQKNSTATKNQQNNYNQAQNPNPNAQSNRATSFFSRHPFLTTFGTILAASWLGHMIFGSGGFAAGSNLFGGFLLNLIFMIIGAFAVVMLVRFLTRNTSTSNSSTKPLLITDIQIPESEKKEFIKILIAVQNAWSNQDITSLKTLTTPEMAQYFSQNLAQNISQDIANKVEDVEVTDIQISESWRENDMEYVTTIIEWSAFDYMVNLKKNPTDQDYIIEGNDKVMFMVCEAWTFVRYPGGKWLLSAIAQV